MSLSSTMTPSYIALPPLPPLTTSASHCPELPISIPISQLLGISDTSILDAILPPSICLHAWAPVAPSFSVYFACHMRHYEYTFSCGILTLTHVQQCHMPHQRTRLLQSVQAQSSKAACNLLGGNLWAPFGDNQQQEQEHHHSLTCTIARASWRCFQIGESGFFPSTTIPLTCPLGSLSNSPHWLQYPLLHRLHLHHHH